METIDFSQPLRQSSKGILIIFAFNTFKFFKKFFVLFIAFGVSIMRRKSIGSLTPTMIILAFLAILIIILIIAILKYLNFKFHISKDDFHLSTGILNKDSTIVPKSKIQNVYIKQNFLQQLINVVSVNIETAGDKKSEIEISALDKPTALLLKKELYSKANVESVSISEELTSEVFFRASPKRLLLEGVSQNHFKSFAIIFSFVLGLYYQFEEYIGELKLIDKVEEFVNLDEQTLLNILFLNLVAFLLVMVLSLLFSVIKTFVINFNLEVVEHQKTVEINKGLFNKVSLSLTPSRIQNLVITTNRIKQYFGLFTMSVRQAMVNKKQQNNFNIVALEKQQMLHLVQKLLNNYTFDSNRLKPSIYYVRILILKALVWVVIINVFAMILSSNALFWINVLVLPFASLYVYMTYKKAHYSITNDFVTIGSGFIDTTTNILEIHKIQAVKLKQSIIQKRRKIASVEILTASKSVTIPYINENNAKSVYDFLLFKVESQDRDWM
ncbi:PH domain-containing protein [Winogradskyella pulchriflava]|uniref:PH domain-containing protein n=1 Tax=Winogradskyella pulchriflava TaxID=1110688 RepID=A0ABV6Q7X5_9FLAO